MIEIGDRLGDKGVVLASTPVPLLQGKLAHALRQRPQKARKPPGERRLSNSGGRIRTCDLRVMSPTSYLTAPPRGGQKTIAAPWRPARAQRPGNGSVEERPQARGVAWRERLPVVVEVGEHFGV